jgi:hypothetical protein
MFKIFDRVTLDCTPKNSTGVIACILPPNTSYLGSPKFPTTRYVVTFPEGNYFIVVEKGMALVSSTETTLKKTLKDMPLSERKQFKYAVFGGDMEAGNFYWNNGELYFQYYYLSSDRFAEYSGDRKVGVAGKAYLESKGYDLSLPFNN